MVTSRDIRRLAFQVLFQIDAHGGEGLEALREHVDDSIREMDVEFSKGEKEKAIALATGAYENRAAADAVMLELAPTWPASRQAAVDRAILRLAHYEMTRGKTPPKVAVNEAVELAKTFSTEKSPAFINGLLDKVLKRVLAAKEEGASQEGGGVRAETGGSAAGSGDVGVAGGEGEGA
jgi:transcription antitermination protein NusB